MSKTRITGSLTNRLGNPFIGKLIISLPESIPDFNTNPSTLTISGNNEVIIPNGEVDVTLTESLTLGVTYTFAFYEQLTSAVDTSVAVYSESPSLVINSFVPPSVEPLDINKLIQTGISLAGIDSSLGLITNSVVNSPTFINKVLTSFIPRGEFNEDAIYKLNDLVKYNGRQYRYISTDQSSENYPPISPIISNEYWIEWGGDKGDPGSGTNGDDTAYGASWDGNLIAPSKNSIYDKIETLATKTQLQSDYAPLNSPALTNTPTAPTPSTNDSSTRIATTSFVKAQNYLISNAAASVSSLSSSGIVTASQFKLSMLNTAPSSSTATASVGTILIDANYIYVAVSNNQFKRVALSSF